MSLQTAATRPDWDPELVTIADYVLDERGFSEAAQTAARLILIDSLGCAL